MAGKAAKRIYNSATVRLRVDREASEEIAGFENRLSGIESDVKLLKWMVGTNIVLTFGILLRLFTAS